MLFQVDWSTNLGEHARNLVVMRYSRTLAPNKHELVVIGEQSAAALDPAQRTMERWINSHQAEHVVRQKSIMALHFGYSFC